MSVDNKNLLLALADADLGSPFSSTTFPILDWDVVRDGGLIRWSTSGREAFWPNNPNGGSGFPSEAWERKPAYPALRGVPVIEIESLSFGRPYSLVGFEENDVYYHRREFSLDWTDGDGIQRFTTTQTYVFDSDNTFEIEETGGPPDGEGWTPANPSNFQESFSLPDSWGAAFSRAVDSTDRGSPAASYEGFISSQHDAGLDDSTRAYTRARFRPLVRVATIHAGAKREWIFDEGIYKISALLRAYPSANDGYTSAFDELLADTSFDIGPVTLTHDGPPSGWHETIVGGTQVFWSSIAPVDLSSYSSRGAQYDALDVAGWFTMPVVEGWYFELADYRAFPASGSVQEHGTPLAAKYRAATRSSLTTQSDFDSWGNTA